MKFNLFLFLYFSFLIVILKAQSPRLSRKHTSCSGVVEESILLKDAEVVFRVNSHKLYRKEYKGRQMFVCNSQYYSSFDEAVECLKKVNLAFRNQKSKNRLSKDPYEEFNIQCYLGTTYLGNKIWRKVWKDCDYKCFSPFNYKVLKMKLVEEMNEIRKHYNSPPLSYSATLSKLAAKHAAKMAKYGLVPYYTHNPFYNTLSGAVLYLAANTMVNKWYEESKYFDFINFKPRKGLSAFTQLVWKSTRSVGVGVAGKNHVLYIVFAFYPKGNAKNKFSKNVFSRQE